MQVARNAKSDIPGGRLGPVEVFAAASPLKCARHVGSPEHFMTGSAGTISSYLHYLMNCNRPKTSTLMRELNNRVSTHSKWNILLLAATEIIPS
jgi:hypothetical protein